MYTNLGWIILVWESKCIPGFFMTRWHFALGSRASFFKFIVRFFAKKGRVNFSAISVISGGSSRAAIRFGLQAAAMSDEGCGRETGRDSWWRKLFIHLSYPMNMVQIFQFERSNIVRVISPFSQLFPRSGQLEPLICELLHFSAPSSAPLPPTTCSICIHSCPHSRRCLRRSNRMGYPPGRNWN